MEFIKSFFRYSVRSALFLLISVPAFSQQPVLRPAPVKRDTTLSTTKTDTLANKSRPAAGLNSKVNYTAQDSIRFDHINNIVHLYGKARIIYDDFELDADYIRLDQKNNLAFAKGYTNPRTNRYSGRPILKQGSEQPITTDSLLFNYKTKKGKSYGVFTDVEGGYLQARQFKKNEYDEGFFKRGIYSTCNLSHPHFGIHITRGIVTDKQIITGPAYLTIEDVPLPLGVPFGFFPKPNRRSGGLLFPTFGEDTERGFYMRDLGYYFGISDYWDMAVRGSFYSKGSYESNTQARYKKNYRYDGSLSLRFASTKTGIEGTETFDNPAKDFNIGWTHSQRPESNPGTTFSASVNAGTGSYFSNTAAAGTYDFDELTRNTLSSNISYGKTWTNGMNFTSTLGHRQEIEAGTIALELPSFSFNVPTFNPFDNKDRVGEQKWFQKITMGYNLQGSNSINTTEEQLFGENALQQFRSGFQHNIPVTLSLNVLKYLQFNSGVQYNERWYLQTIRKTSFPLAGSPVIDTVAGFSRAYEYSMNSGLSTKFYGTKIFTKGKIEAIRHVITPSFSFNYRPDFGDNDFGYYQDVILDTEGRTQRYSIYEGAVYGGPGMGKQAGIGFNIDNNIEAKRRATQDSVQTATSDKIPILQNLSFSGNYNFAAEEGIQKLSPINFSGRTAFFKQKLGINFNGILDPYKADSLGGRSHEFMIESGKLARLTNFGLSTDFSLNSSALQRRNENLNQIGQNMQGATPQQAQELARISRDPNAFVDFSVPWNISASYSFQYSKLGLTSSITNTLNFYGDFNVTPKWKVQYNSGYDFQAHKLSLTQISIYRDLHCWDLAFRWVPIGQYRSYSVDLKVKASVLQDLKLSRRRDYFNTF